MLKNKICTLCDNQIEQERIEILPDTICCAKCAHIHNVVKPRKGIMVFDGKTGGTLQTMSADYFEANRQYFTPIKAQSQTKFSKEEF